MITFTLRTTHKFFHLLISTCSKAYLSHCEQSWLSIPIQTCFLHPPTFFFSTKLKSAEKLNTAVMYGAELRLPLFLSLIGFNKRLFDQRVTPPWPTIYNCLPTAGPLIHYLFPVPFILVCPVDWLGKFTFLWLTLVPLVCSRLVYSCKICRCPTSLF